MIPIYLLSCLCLSFVAVICMVGCFSPRYDDNMLQRIGMAVLGMGCIARVQSIWAAEVVANDWFLVHGGMALVAAGTAWKLYRKT